MHCTHIRLLYVFFAAIPFLQAPSACAQKQSAPGEYFADTIAELQKVWPKNRTVRFVFHGHSVPAGYFRTPTVQRFDSYPHLFQQRMGEVFTTVPIDVSITAIGGEESDRGAKRFAEDVLPKKPDVVLIDYSLNDRRIGLQRADVAWRSMIKACQDADVKVILLTPTPDTREDLLDDDAPLAKHARQVRRLGKEFGVPVVDSFAEFQRLVEGGNDVKQYMSQTNHPNRAGHEVVADLLVELFVPTSNDKPAQQWAE